MNLDLQSAIETFLLKKMDGKIIEREDIDATNAKLDGLLPQWFVEMMVAYPLSGAQFEFPQNEEYDGYLSFEIATLPYLYNEPMEAYPGIAIRELGYFCIGTDPTGSGDQYFVSNKQGDNPPVYQVYHDVGETAEVIEKEGMVEIAGSLSELFSNARFL